MGYLVISVMLLIALILILEIHLVISLNDLLILVIHLVIFLIRFSNVARSDCFFLILETELVIFKE